jgi:short-subunit dehydrogenase
LKTAVITGATKGIGRAVSETLWKDGYSLAVCARTRDDLEAMQAVLTPMHADQQFLWQVVDVADREQVNAFAATIEAHWDHVDVLMNNAGIFNPGGVLVEEEGVLEQMFRVNVLSAYDLTRSLMPLLKRARNAHIFNMCSIASIQAYPNGGAYTISKFALLGFSKILREETKPLGIKVTAVIAGATWSDSWKGADFPDDRLMSTNDIVIAINAALQMSPAAVVEEILIRPQLGDL